MLLLDSERLFEPVSDTGLKSLIAQNIPFDEIAAQMVAHATEAENQDNVSVILVRKTRSST